MYVGTHNIWDTDQAFVIGKKIKRYTNICGLQEFDLEEYDDLMRGLGPNWVMVNESVNVPFVFDTNYVLLAAACDLPPGFQNRGVKKLHDPSDVGPARYLSWIIVTFPRQPWLPPVAFVDFHLQHKAWNGRERNVRRLELRRDNWDEGYDQALWTVSNMRKHGLTVIWLGDYNRLKKRTPQFFPRQVHVAGNGIDQIYIAKGRGRKAANFKVYPHLEKRINTPSDHPLIAGNIKFLVP